MKEILSSNFDLVLNNVNAITFYGDGANITGVDTIPYYSWVGLIRVTDVDSQLFKLQGDDYFGDLNITSPYNITNGVDVTSTNGSIFTTNKTFLIPPKFLYPPAFPHATTVTITESKLTFRLGTDGLSSPPGGGLGKLSAFEIKVYK